MTVSTKVQLTAQFARGVYMKIKTLISIEKTWSCASLKTLVSLSDGKQPAPNLSFS